MQGLPTLRYGTALLQARVEHTSTVAALEADPRTTTQCQKFKAFGDRWTGVFGKELALTDDQVRAQSVIWYIDTLLDGAVLDLERTVLLIVGGDKASPTYQRYFGDKTAAQLIRPILGDELETVRKFVPGLVAANEPRMKEIGQRLETLVTQADDAVRRRDLADAAMADFRNTGERKRFIDEFNALRVSVFGELAEMPHAHPEWNLPSDFARSFFRNQRVTYRGKTTATTSAEIDDQIAQAQQQLIDLQTQRAEAVAREQKHSEDQAKLAANLRALEEAQAQMSDLRNRIANLTNKVQRKR